MNYYTEINGDDWEKVVILKDKAYIPQTKKREEIPGNTGLINCPTATAGTKKPTKSLRWLWPQDDVHLC